jgi:outer membrane protein assembly factor BamD
MIHIRVVILISFLLLFNSCSKEEKKVAIIQEQTQELEFTKTYKEAYEELDRNDPYIAAKKFLEAELMYPQSTWAPKSALMASYSYYLQNYYIEAISNLERYLITYPNDINLSYAHYLIAMSYFEMIEDEKRDSEPIIKAKEKFNYIIESFPDTDFALDAKFKYDLIENILASKEMYIGRHYQKKNKWIAAINRFKNVISIYDETAYVEEALHRLVEIHYKIGLVDESQKYANLLGYNYQSSDWYLKSYKIFNQDYKEVSLKEIKKDRKGVFDKFRKIFD